MSILVNLDRLLLDRKLTLTELADRVGITIANLSILKTNKARAIRFSTLEALCRELNCQPSELLRYMEDDISQDGGGENENESASTAGRTRARKE